MNVTKYRAFLKILETGNMTRAADQLGYSQPGLTHMIDSMENELGFPVLRRNKDKITLTENGKEILYYCRQIVKNEDYLLESVSSINGLLSGTIKISSCNGLILYFLPTVISDFSRVHEKISISLQEDTHAETVHNLVNNIIDIGFMDKNVPDGFEFIPLFKDHIRLIMPKSHPLASQKKVRIEQLNGSDLIMPMPGSDDLIKYVYEKKKFTSNYKYEVASDVAAIEMVARELGMFILSENVTLDLPDSVIAKDFAEDVYRTLGIALRSLKNTTPAIKEFIKFSQKASGRIH